MNAEISFDSIRLIVLDIDGTLLDSSHQLRERTRSVLLKCRENGIPFTFASGKNWDAALSLVEDLDIEVPLILANGAYVRDRRGSQKAKVTIPSETMRQVIRIFREEKADLIVYLNDEEYAERVTPNLAHLEKYGSPKIIEIEKWEALDGRLGNVHKCMAVEKDNLPFLPALQRRLQAELGSELEICLALPEILDITPIGVNKASGLRLLCPMLGIELDNVLAFGDGNNDVEMFDAAGISVALANASQPATAHADIVVPSNDCDGPAQLLEFLLKSSA